MRWSRALLAGLAAAALAAPATSLAAPVENGLIAYTGDPGGGGHGVRVVAPDGTGDRPLIANGLQIVDVEWSPDGRRLAFVADGDFPDRTLFTAAADGSGQAARLTAPHLASPTWSPDGSSIAVTTNAAAIVAVPAAGGPAKQLYAAAEDDTLSEISWSPSGQRMLLVETGVGDADGIDVLTLATGTVRGLTSPPDVQDFSVRDAAPTWSPDGGTVLFTRTFTHDFAPDSDWVNLMLADPDGSDVRELADASYWSPAPRFSPDGRHTVERAGGRQGVHSLFVRDLATRAGRHLPLGGEQSGPRDTQVSWQPVVAGDGSDASGGERERGRAPSVTPRLGRTGLLRGARMRMRCARSGLLTARLVRNGRTVARARRRVRRGPCSFTLLSRKGMRPGRYVLVVRLKSASRTTTTRMRVRVRAPRTTP